jgi:hypothetical protein
VTDGHNDAGHPSGSKPAGKKLKGKRPRRGKEAPRKSARELVEAALMRQTKVVVDGKSRRRPVLTMILDQLMREGLKGSARALDVRRNYLRLADELRAKKPKKPTKITVIRMSQASNAEEECNG